MGFYGAGDEARTRYLHLGKVALYRMSYTRASLSRTRLIISGFSEMSTGFSKKIQKIFRGLFRGVFAPKWEKTTSSPLGDGAREFADD